MIYLGNKAIKIALSSLPSTYQEVEYIQNSGNQYIDTGVLASSKNSFKVKAQLIHVNETSQTIWGGRKTNMPELSNQLSHVKSSGTYQFSYGDKLVNPKKFDTNLHIFYADKNNLYIDGEYITGVAETTFQGTNSVYLFGTNTNGTIGFAGGSMKLYYCQIWSDDTLIRDYVPCYRKSDKKPGLFDKVNKLFYTNISGVGDFTYPQNQQSYSSTFGRIRIPPMLPIKYKQVEYIEGTSEQYIDTNLKLNNNSRLILDYKLMENYPSLLFGARSSSSTGMFSYNISEGYLVSGYADELIKKLLEPDFNRHIVDKNKNTIYIDGVLKHTYKVQTFETQLTADLFACASSANGGHGYIPCAMVLYSCKIYDNDILVRNFIPCYRKSDGEIGLYDIVNDIFYENKGTGSFLKGTDID